MTTKCKEENYDLVNNHLVFFVAAIIFGMGELLEAF